MLRSSLFALLFLSLVGCDKTDNAEASEEAATESGAEEWPESSVISGDVAHELVERGARLVDVRRPDEFQAGSIDGATNIPVDELTDRLDELEPKDGPLVVYCRSGRRSARAAEALSEAAFEHVYDLGGMSNW